MWMLFYVPCPTPDGHTAENLYQKRRNLLTPELKADAREHGCHFHRIWHAKDGFAFYALVEWESQASAWAFYKKWDMQQDEPGEKVTFLEGDDGLVPLPELPVPRSSPTS
jgi:hypothetical protein